MPSGFTDTTVTSQARGIPQSPDTRVAYPVGDLDRMSSNY